MLNGKRVQHRRNHHGGNGRIVDASFVEVTRQRNTREENEQIKQYQTHEACKEKPNKLRQKDVEARLTKKIITTFFGYKNHVKTDKETKLIDTYVVTSASVHDSQALEDLINKDDRGLTLHVDRAYIGQEKTVDKCSMVEQIHERDTKTKKLTDYQKKSNRRKLSIRCRVEHVFGFMTNTMKAMYIRTFGINRAKAKIGLTNLTYNMMRYVQLGKPVYNVFLI